MSLAGSATNAATAGALISTSNPDLIILDLGDGDRGVSAAVALQRRGAAKILFFSSCSDIKHAVAAFEAGAAGYMTTSGTDDEILDAVATVSRGENYITPALAGQVIAMLRATSANKGKPAEERLSYREGQIAKLLLQGHTNKQIGASLGISEKTVKHYMTGLMAKLDSRNRTELALSLRQTPAGSQSIHFN